MRDDSDYLRLPRALERPPLVRPVTDPRLLGLADFGLERLVTMLERYPLSPAGDDFAHQLPPALAKDLLLQWLSDIGHYIRIHRLAAAVADALYPLPPGTIRGNVYLIFSGIAIPHRELLVHSLFAVGLSAPAVTIAALLAHHASHPLPPPPIREDDTSTLHGSIQ